MKTSVGECIKKFIFFKGLTRCISVYVVILEGCEGSFFFEEGSVNAESISIFALPF